MRITSQVFVGAMLAATFALSSVSAQAQNVRVRGTIEKLDGNSLAVKSRDGTELKLVLKDNVRVGGVVKASLADVKANAAGAVDLEKIQQLSRGLLAASLFSFSGSNRW